MQRPKALPCCPLRLAALCLLIQGCVSTTEINDTPQKSYGQNAKEAYVTGLKLLRDNECTEGEEAFRQVRRKYPYSRYAALAELRIGDCLIKEKKNLEAVDAYQRFIRNRPSHREIPYAHFRVADAYYRQIPSEWFLSPPQYELDQGPARSARKYFDRYIEDYPDHKYLPLARRKLREVLTLLARHELYAAEFYLRRDKEGAAIRRLNTLLKRYPDSLIEAEVLWKLAELYDETKQPKKSKAVLTFLVQRHPKSEYAAQAREKMNRAI